MLSTGADRQDNINVTIAIIGVVHPQRHHRLLPGVPRREGHRGAAEAGAGQRQGGARRRGDDRRRRRPGARRPHRPRGGRQHQRRRARDAPVRDVDQQHRPHRRVGRRAQDGRPDHRGGARRHQHAQPGVHGHDAWRPARAGRSSSTPASTRSSGASSRSPPASPRRSRRCSARSTAWRGTVSIIAIVCGVAAVRPGRCSVFNFGSVARCSSPSASWSRWCRRACRRRCPSRSPSACSAWPR